MTPLVSILIAYPAPSPYLDESLAGIAKQTYRNFEVILLPNAASGRQWPEWCVEIPTGKLRPAEKRNMGIAKARGEIIAFLDDDAWPVEAWLEKAVSHFAKSEIVGVGGPGETPLNDPFLAQMSGRVYENVLVSGGYRHRYRAGAPGETDDWPSCNFFVRTDAARQLNGFRTDYWPGEDTYMCMELTKTLGKRIVYEPGALVYHHRRALFLPHLRQIGRYGLHRGYFARHFPSTSRRIGYMMPSLFVLGLIFGGAGAAFLSCLRLPYAIGVACYLLATLAASVGKCPYIWLLTWLGVMATHVTYGVRFLVGYFVQRLPGEVQRFDHPSERK
jgi:glycosyltransferase involved in cell wall biosynthesis